MWTDNPLYVQEYAYGTRRRRIDNVKMRVRKFFHLTLDRSERQIRIVKSQTNSSKGTLEQEMET